MSEDETRADAPTQTELDAARDLGALAYRGNLVLYDNPWTGALPVEDNVNHPCWFAWRQGWLAERHTALLLPRAHLVEGAFPTKPLAPPPPDSRGAGQAVLAIEDAKRRSGDEPEEPDAA